MAKKLLPVTPKNMDKMAKELAQYLIGRHLFEDVTIYAAGNKYTQMETDERLFKAEPFDMDKIPVEYNNPDTLTCTFEGPLYDALNAYDIYDTGKTESDLNKIFAKYGNKHPLYLEYGYAWSFAVYE